MNLSFHLCFALVGRVILGKFLNLFKPQFSQLFKRDKKYLPYKDLKVR